VVTKPASARALELVAAALAALTARRREGVPLLQLESEIVEKFTKGTSWFFGWLCWALCKYVCRCGHAPLGNVSI
jgi:hypothetical protein